MTSHAKLSPIVFRYILSIAIILIVSVAVAGFIYSYKQLNTYAVEVSHKKTDDAASSNSLQLLQTTETVLKKNQQAIVRAQSITATGELPQFTAIHDIKAYAARHNLALQSVEFVSSTSQASSTTPQTSSTPKPAASTSTNSVDVSISFASDVNLQDFLQFLSDIEHNIPKMQVEGVNLSKGASPDTVNSGPLIIHMYTN